MKADKKKSGFTLVELMVASVAVAILALTVGSMLYYGWLGWRRYSESVAMQRNAMVAMRVIEHRIRNANLDEISWNASTVAFASDDNFSTAEINPAADVLLVPGTFSVASNGLGGVDVFFNLRGASGGDENRYEMTIYPRN